MYKRKKYKKVKLEIICILGAILLASGLMQEVAKLMVKLAEIVLVYGTIFLGIKQLYKWIKYSNREYSSEEIECRIGNMTPREFEIFCGNLFRELGYKCKVTSESIDGGKDVILEDEYGEIIYVECKHYKKENLVNREVLQKLVGASVGDGINKAIIITTSDYTARAYEYALNVKWLELWTMKDLIKAMGKIKKQGFVLYKLEG